MTIELFLNNEWVDITEYVDVNSINIQSRCDEAFAIGNLNAWMIGETWKYNIPPYTPMKIDSIFYACESVSNRHLSKEGMYIHNFSLMESTSVLATILIGTKYFSVSGNNAYDYQKVAILKNLVNDKLTQYAAGVSINNSYESVFTKKIEYSFGAGSTLFDCLNEIAKNYNYRVYVNSFYFYDNLYSAPLVSVSFVPIYAPISISYDKILSASYSQNNSKYGSLLETECHNVVDRTTLTNLNMVTCRADDSKYNADEAKLYTPTRIESIKSFGIESVDRYIWWEIKGQFVGSQGEQLTGTHQISDLYWYNSSIRDAFEYRLKDFWSYGEFVNVWVTLNDDVGYWRMLFTSGVHSGQTNLVTMKYDLTHKLLEKAQWDLLTPAEQCGYAVYDSGNNCIYNLNAEYKSDFWGTILGQRKKSILEKSFEESEETYLVGQNNVFKLHINEDTSHSSNPTGYFYYISYYPIADLYLFDEKSEDARNEVRYKKISRSYSANSSMIDFDKVSQNMHITNNTEGKQELTVELDVTDTTIPVAKKTIVYDNKTWYVSSVITQYGNKKVTSTLNCVSDYNKVADCISVDSQYSSIKNDLSTVVTRPIFANLFVSETIFNNILSQNIFFILDFVYLENHYYGVVPAAKFVKDDYVYLFCEMLDQSSIGKYVDVYSDDSNSTNYISYATYTNSNNEVTSVNLRIKNMEITGADSYALPKLNISSTISYASKNILLYKDAREKLTFTIKITKRT